MATFVFVSPSLTNAKTLARESELAKQAAANDNEIDSQLLLTLARKLAEVFIAGDTSNPWLAQHITSDFKGTHDLATTSMSAIGYMDLIKQVRVAYGDRRIEIVDEWVDIDDSDNATVWQTLRYVVEDEPLERSALRILRWRRTGPPPDGIWMCYEYGVFKNDALISGMSAQCFRR